MRRASQNGLRGEFAHGGPRSRLANSRPAWGRIRQMPLPSFTRQSCRTLVAGAALLTCLACAHGGPLAVTAWQQDGKALAGAVVTVEAESPVLPPSAPEHATMDQVDLAFVPDVLVVPVHST